MQFHLRLDVPTRLFGYPMDKKSTPKEEIEMNQTPETTILRNIEQIFTNTFGCWLIQPETQIYTYEDYIGDPSDEYAQAAACPPAAPQAIEIEPEEFEAVYNWFIA
jgi:hypothetical protein